MSTDPGQRPESRPAAARPDAGHLDEDAEALEDPVHAGDARHQHEQHERDRLTAERDGRDDTAC